MQIYESLLQDWARQAGIAIQIGSKQVCRLQFPKDQVTLQIDLDPTGELLVLSAILGKVDPGTYRNQLFKCALQDNGAASTPRGILCFSDQLSSLMAFEFLSVATMTPEKLNHHITLFRAHVKKWVEAIKQGNLPVIETEQSAAKGSGMFGLKS